MSRVARPSISILTVAFCASLSLHTLLLVALASYYVRSIGLIYLPGFEQHVVQSQLVIDDALGKQDATGNATDDSPGEEPMLARQADENQAFLSRDPAGPGAMRSSPSPSVAPLGAAAIMPSPAVEHSQAQPQRETPFGVASIEQAAMNEGEGPKHNQSPPAPEIASPQVPAAAQVNPTPPAPAQMADHPGVAIAPADPAPQSDTESDPFTTVGSAQFHAGKLNAQIGRPHRLVAPRIGMAGLIEGQSLGRVELVLEITIDVTGNVRRVAIFQSSGGTNIDQDCRVAAYQWWFEPRKLPNGTVRPETFLFPIKFI